MASRKTAGKTKTRKTGKKTGSAKKTVSGKKKAKATSPGRKLYANDLIGLPKKRIVHVVGTGTVGEVVIALLCKYKKVLGFDEITFQKHTPRPEDRPKIKHLVECGAKLYCEKDKLAHTRAIGLDPNGTAIEAQRRATIILDASPAGNDNKSKWYVNREQDTIGFIAQGSEDGFGKKYVLGINGEALSHGEDRYVQVVSCNTHNLSAILHCLAMENGEAMDNVHSGRFVCMRRALDVTQASGFLPSPEVGLHKYERFGTHHARDAHMVFKTLGLDLNLFSSAVKLNTQFMHCLWFDIKLKEKTTLKHLLSLIRRNPLIATSVKTSSTQIFSSGRDHGYFGRILNQTVIPIDTLSVSRSGKEIVGFCFTPQDGNTFLSSVAAATWFIHPEDYLKRIRAAYELLFDEV